MDKLLRLSDVSAQIGVPEATLRFWRHQGRGPTSANLGGPRGRVVFRQSDVDAWIAAQFGDAPADAGTPPAPAVA